LKLDTVIQKAPLAVCAILIGNRYFLREIVFVRALRFGMTFALRVEASE
jgi:hypothetical protein